MPGASLSRGPPMPSASGRSAVTRASQVVAFASGGSQSEAVESLLRDAGPHRHHMEQLLQTAVLDTHLDDRSRALDRMLGAAPVV